MNNLSEGIHKIKCKHGHDDKKCEILRNNYKYCNCFLEYTNFKEDKRQMFMLEDILSTKV